MLQFGRTACVVSQQSHHTLTLHTWGDTAEHLRSPQPSLTAEAPNWPASHRSVLALTNSTPCISVHIGLPCNYNTSQPPDQSCSVCSRCRQLSCAQAEQGRAVPISVLADVTVLANTCNTKQPHGMHAMPHPPIEQ